MTCGLRETTCGAGRAERPTGRTRETICGGAEGARFEHAPSREARKRRREGGVHRDSAASARSDGRQATGARKRAPKRANAA